MIGAGAQTKPWNPDLVNLTTPGVLEQGDQSTRLDLRAFQQDEGIGYGEVELGFGLGHRLEADFKGVFGSRGSHGIAGGGSIDHGGSDGEVQLKYRLPFAIETSVQAGVALASTPAQDGRLSATAGLSVFYPLASRVKLYVNPRVAALDHNSLAGIGVGTEIELSGNLSLVGDWTPLVAGDNTVNTTSGSRDRAQVYSAALRISRVAQDTFIDIGYTSATGGTTGFGLTPGLGGSGAFYAGVTFRR
jgi:hypothetical protein